RTVGRDERAADSGCRSADVAWDDARPVGVPMVQVRVAGIALDEAGQHVLLLKPVEDLPGAGRMLPIWIGSLEATSILIAIEGAETPRPLAHDLIRSI